MPTTKPTRWIDKRLSRGTWAEVLRGWSAVAAGIAAAARWLEDRMEDHSMSDTVDVSPRWTDAAHLCSIGADALLECADALRKAANEVFAALKEDEPSR
jgi:hypothetical protein